MLYTSTCVEMNNRCGVVYFRHSAADESHDDSDVKEKNGNNENHSIYAQFMSIKIRIYEVEYGVQQELFT